MRCTRSGLGLVFLLFFGGGGCALTYIDANGDQHAIGFLDVAVRSPASIALAGDVVEVSSLGLSIGQTAQGGYVTAGFNRVTTAALRDNSLVLGNPILGLSLLGDRTEGQVK